MRHVTERAAQLIEAAMLEYIASRQHEAQKSTRVYTNKADAFGIGRVKNKQNNKTMQEELKVKLADARACYANASNEVKEVLEHLFGREAFAFDFRSIKSFEDACKHLGISDELPAQRAGVAYDKEAVEQSLAAYKLMVICKAINNGQQYDEDGDTWFPLYYFYTKSELERMGEDERKRKGIQLLSAAAASSAEYAGVRFAHANPRGALTHAHSGFPLCANSEEKALYLDEQFRGLIYQCYGIKVKEEE